MPKFDDVKNSFCSSGGGVTRRAEARLFEWRGVSRREEEASFFEWRGVSPPSGFRNGPRERARTALICSIR